MGYWDRSETKRKSRWGDEPEEEVKERPKNGDNINVKALDELEKDMQETSSTILNEVEGIAESIKRQKAIAKDTLSANYWFAVCFNNDVQKHQFLEAVGFNPSWTFIQGDQFAKAIGVSYKEPNHDYSKERRVNPNFKARARKIER